MPTHTQTPHCTYWYIYACLCVRRLLSSLLFFFSSADLYYLPYVGWMLPFLFCYFIWNGQKIAHTIAHTHTHRQNIVNTYMNVCVFCKYYYSDRVFFVLLLQKRNNSFADSGWMFVCMLLLSRADAATITAFGTSFFCSIWFALPLA